MEIICLHDEAFFALVEQVVARIKDKEKIKVDKWVNGQEAMKLLRIQSKSTLQKYRDEGKIRFSQPDRKTLLYDTDSIFEFIEKNAKNTF